MKSYKIIIYVCLILAVSCNYFNSAQAHFTFGLQGGMFAPQNTSNDNRIWNYGDWNRLNGSYEIGGYLGYYISNFETRIETSFRNEHHITSTIFYYYKNDLEIMPIDFSFIYHSKKTDSKFMPYLGVGTGIYIASWKTADVTLIFMDTYYQRMPRAPISKYAREYAVDAHILAGFETPLSARIFLNSEFRYTRVSGEWRITPNTAQDRVHINLGGISLKFGLGYNF